MVCGVKVSQRAIVPHHTRGRGTSEVRGGASGVLHRGLGTLVILTQHLACYQCTMHSVT